MPFREISLAPTKTMSGEIEVNEPVCVYDTSGPWGDADQRVEVTEGLPALRAKWIRDRGDVEETEGRPVTPQDNGFLSRESRAEPDRPQWQSAICNVFNLKSRKPLRASPGHAVTQLWYAREGIITPEMEFIAIRENAGRDLKAEIAVRQAQALSWSRRETGSRRV